MSKRPPPTPPYPDLVRKPKGRFGWLEDRLLHDRWLAELGPDATAVLVFLALAANRQGASFYGRDRIASALGMNRPAVDAALHRLRDLRLVALRPWRSGVEDGVWQLLPVPELEEPSRGPAGDAQSAAEILASLGFD